MAGTDHFIEKLAAWLEAVDETALVALSNKGIFKRSVKEVKRGLELTVTVGDAEVRCRFPDGVNCVLTPDHAGLRCSCSSRKVCRHLIVAILVLHDRRHELGLGTVSDDAVLPVDFSSIAAIAIPALKAAGTIKAWKEAVFRLTFGVRPELREASELIAIWPEEGVTVSLPAVETLKGGSCSCGEERVCSHKLEAVLAYQIQALGVDPEALDDEEGVAAPVPLAAELIRYAADVMALGLGRVPASFIELAGQLAVRCAAAGLAAPERSLRRIGSELRLLIERHSSFSRRRLRLDLTGLFVAGSGLTMMASGSMRLAGVPRATYVQVPPMLLYGVGARAWRARSGYVGVTCYFFHPARSRWYTYSVSRPTYYEKSATRGRTSRGGNELKREPAPWGLEGVSLTELSRAVLRLRHGRLSREGRLSSSTESVASITGRTRPYLSAMAGAVFDRWSCLVTGYERHSAWSPAGRDDTAFNLAVVKVSHWGEGSFDDIEQIYTVPVYDVEGSALLISCPFSEDNEKMIERLEALEESGRRPEHVFGELFVTAHQLCISPVSLMFPGGEMINLSME